MSTPTLAQLKAQLAELKRTGLDKKLATAAKAAGLDYAFLLAIGSRETNLRNELGDYRGGVAHGIGILQIDVQHPIALAARDTGSWWPHPEPLIAFGAELLASNLAGARKNLPNLTDLQIHKVAAAGYNCGLTTAINAAKAGNCDARTTPPPYGADVIARMAIFASLLTQGAS
jgi:hypothetical protein